MAHEREDLLDNARRLLDDGKPDGASAVCRKGLRRYPRDADLWFTLGDSLYDEGRIPQADKAYRRAVEHRPGWALALARRAETSVMLGRVLRARGLLDAAYLLDRDLAYTNWMRAVLCDIRGEDTEALFWYRRAQKLDPDTYFIPASVGAQRFDKEFAIALKHLDCCESVRKSLTATRWVVLDRVEPGIPEIQEACPLACAYLIPNEDTPEPEGSTCEHPPISTGFIFRRNVLRNCRTPDDVCAQIHLSVLDDLESFVCEGSGEEE